jgi:hypothetical protein
MDAARPTSRSLARVENSEWKAAFQVARLLSLACPSVHAKHDYPSRVIAANVRLARPATAREHANGLEKVRYGRSWRLSRRSTAVARMTATAKSCHSADLCSCPSVCSGRSMALKSPRRYRPRPRDRRTHVAFGRNEPVERLQPAPTSLSTEARRVTASADCGLKPLSVRPKPRMQP